MQRGGCGGSAAGKKKSRANVLQRRAKANGHGDVEGMVKGVAAGR